MLSFPTCTSREYSKCTADFVRGGCACFQWHASASLDVTLVKVLHLIDFDIQWTEG